MYRKKNYSKYYKENYLKKKNNKFRCLKVICTISFILTMFVSSIFIFYILIGSDNNDTMGIDEACTNQVVSIKKKDLRTDFTAWNRICDWNLILINNTNNIPVYFSPQLKQYGEIEVDERIVSELAEMIQEASKDNAKLWISSGYRTKERQEQLFNKEVEEHLKCGMNKDEALDLAMKTVSMPDNNEHNIGLSVDFNAAGEEFCSTKEYEWLIENSTTYGFILRYPKDKESITGRKFEPAHFRYVGQEHAKDIKLHNLCLEEYISTLMN